MLTDQQTLTGIETSPESNILDELAQAAMELEAIKEERDALSAQHRALFDNLQARYGCNRAAIKAAIAYAKMSPERQTNWDWTYRQARNALDCPLQPDLFNEDFAEKVTAATQRTH
jgi:hypothetical protein